MKLAEWRVRSLVSGLAALLFSFLVTGGIGLTELLRPELLSWNVVTVVLVTLFTLGPGLIGMSFLTDLCEETEEDRRRQSELAHLLEELRKGEYPLQNLTKHRG